MIIKNISIKNFRALKDVPWVNFTDMPVIVGKNDVGKSSVIYGLSLFFGQRTLANEDLSAGADASKPIEIEVAFDGFDEALLKQLLKRKLLAKNGNLVMKKSFLINQRQPQVSLLVKDFTEADFQGFCCKKEYELNALAKKCGLDFTKAGRSITSDDKIQQLLDFATRKGIGEDDVWINPDKDVLKFIEETLPTFSYFSSNLNLNTDQANFQNPFLDMIVGAIEIDSSLGGQVQSKVTNAISDAITKIQENLLEQTDAIKKIIPKPEFQWKKLVSLTLETEDQYGTKIALDNRGLGVQRLVMVAFLKYLAEKPAQNKSIIFAIEEPETYLHPSAQRVLIESFRKLRTKGHQIIITSHSPVFVAEAGTEDLILITRESNVANAIQHPKLSMEQIIEELGIMPRDSLLSYDVCVFVEGITDKVYFETICKTLKNEGKIDADFDDRRIGFVLVGGHNLCFYVELNMLKKLSRKFVVIVDSDKQNPTDQIKKRKLDWQKKCESQKGKFFILRKRSVENYLHPDAIYRVLSRKVKVENFNDVKTQLSTDYGWEKHLKPVVQRMTGKELLEIDKYFDDNKVERHEILNIINEIINLTDHTLMVKAGHSEKNLSTAS